MAEPVTETQFSRLLAGFTTSAFRLETRDHYALGMEQAAYQQFLDGHPQPPSEVGWWQDWLDQIRQQARDGKTISRVRVLAEPPTRYQQWEQWTDPWHADAGERILYLPRSRAEAIALPLACDWWLLDEQRLITMQFTPDGEIAGKELHTDPGTITTYLTWRDLAVRNATPAEANTAA
jgi:hypothetical protein